MTKIILCGSLGKMGQEIQALASEDKTVKVVATVDPKEKKSFKKIEDVDCRADVVIDFSNVEAFDDVLDWCEKKKIPFLSGTTGLEKNQFESLNKTSKKIPVLWSSNMSVGISVVKKMLEPLKSLKGFDFQIIETHHIHKKDAPSGTAKTLLEKLISVVGKSAIKETLSLRLGGIFGDHQVKAASSSEIITIEHRALNRKVFAEGALRAAKWLAKQKPGLYNIDDVLKES